MHGVGHHVRHRYLVAPPTPSAPSDFCPWGLENEFRKGEAGKPWPIWMARLRWRSKPGWMAHYRWMPVMGVRLAPPHRSAPIARRRSAESVNRQRTIRSIWFDRHPRLIVIGISCRDREVRFIHPSTRLRTSRSERHEPSGGLSRVIQIEKSVRGCCERSETDFSIITRAGLHSRR